MGKNRDPEKLLLGLEHQRGIVKINATSPLYTCTWLGDRILVGGGGPAGYGLGRPLGCIGYKDSPPTCNYKPQPGFVSGMSDLREFGHASSVAVTLLESSLQFVKFSNSGHGHELLAEYDTHIGSVQTDVKAKVVAISPSGRVCVVNSDSNSMHVVALVSDPESPTKFKAKWCAMLVGHTKSLSSIAMTYCPIPEGAKSDSTKPKPLLIASIADDNTLRLWITEDIPPSNEENITTWAETTLPRKSTCAGVIPLSRPPSYPETDDSRFKLQLVRFSTEGSELHIIMSRGEGPSFLVSYQLRWKIESKNGKKSSSLTCQTLQSVCLSKEDAVTAFTISKCNNFIVFGTAQASTLAIATRDGEILSVYRNYHNAPILSIAVKQLDGNHLRIATAALSDNFIKVLETGVNQGMSALDVLKVISLFVVVFCMFIGGTAYVTESVPLTCVLNKIAAAHWILPEEDVQSSKMLSYSEGVAPIVRLLFDARSLQTMSTKDPIAILLLCSPPIAAAIIGVILSSSASFFLILFGAISTGIVLGDSTLRLMPLCDAGFGAGMYHYRWLLFFLVMFLLDSCFRTALPNPKLLPTSFAFKRPPRGKLGMSLQGSLVTGIISGGCAEIAGLLPGMRITTVNGKPVSDESAKQAILDAGSEFRVSVELSKTMKSLALSYGPATKPTIAYAILQHLVGIIMVSTRTMQYSVVLTFNAALNELAGVTALYCSGNSPVSTLLIRVALALLWFLIPAGVVSEEVATAAAPWVCFLL